MYVVLGSCFAIGFLGIFAVLGVVFVYDGLWSRPRFTDNRCPRCGYDLVGLLGRKRCPECGDRFLHESDTIQVKHRRNYAEVVAGLAMLAMLAFMIVIILHER